MWDEDGRDWPNREASRFVDAAGLRWHVQVMGRGPAVLLVHGTGAATHSWRDLAQRLETDFTIVAPDLPGHGFTAMPARHLLSLPGMASALGGLLRQLRIAPAVAVGHSAGAAILARMCLDRTIVPRALVSLNGALLPLRGLPGTIFGPMARLAARGDFVPRLFARHATDRSVVERLMRDTGSSIDERGVDLYARLARRPGHVAGAFGMMAHWDLRPLARDLPRLPMPLTLVVGSRDRTIRPSEAHRVQALVPDARIVRLGGLGHLAHEERPERIDALVRELVPLGDAAAA